MQPQDLIGEIIQNGARVILADSLGDGSPIFALCDYCDAWVTWRLYPTPTGIFAEYGVYYQKDQLAKAVEGWLRRVRDS